MWMNVIWLEQPVNAWIPPMDLWDILAKETMPNADVVLGQISDDGPYRWLVLNPVPQIKSLPKNIFRKTLEF